MIKFKTNDFNEDLLTEIINRNFSSYKRKKQEIDDIKGILIRRNLFISCWVFFLLDEHQSEKSIMIMPGQIESGILHFLIFASYFLTGGITLLLGYFVYRNFQAKFRDEVVDIVFSYLSDFQSEKIGKQIHIILK